MKLHFCTPRVELRPYIEKLWVFESDLALHASQSLVAPNGKHKIIIPYKNALITKETRKADICRENDICLIGIREVPVNISTPAGSSGSIGIELTLSGMYKLVDTPLHHLSNSLFSFSELFGKQGATLQDKMAHMYTPQQKLGLIQDFLYHRLQQSRRNSPLADYAIQLLHDSNGLLPVKELQRKTGYSKRYLDLIFNQYLGLPPKKLAAIIRFQRYFKTLHTTTALADESFNLYDLYYDQSHCIREFKRFTGQTPMRYSKLDNRFGKNF